MGWWWVHADAARRERVGLHERLFFCCALVERTETRRPFGLLDRRDFSPQGTASNRRVSPEGYRDSAGGLQGSSLDVLSGRLDSLRRLPGIFLAGPVVPCFWCLRGVLRSLRCVSQSVAMAHVLPSRTHVIILHMFRWLC